MRKRITRLLPQNLRTWGWRYVVEPIRGLRDLRISTRYRDVGPKGPEVLNIFEKIVNVPGAFNLDDMGHFLCILRTQSLLGMKGDILEIGTYYGRSTAVMCHTIKDGETMQVCDAFEAETEDEYGSKPTPAVLMENIRRVTPSFSDGSIKIHNCLSNDLKLGPDDQFRFVHIDGGHSEEQALADLTLVVDHVKPGGVIAVDDYDHRHWPGVTPAVDRFLEARTDYRVFADLNRHGALGRKIYLARD